MKRFLAIGVALAATLLAPGVLAARVFYVSETNLLPGNEKKPPVLDGKDPEGGAVLTYDEETKVLCGRIQVYSALTGGPTGLHVHQAPMGMPGEDGTKTDKIVIPIPETATAEDVNVVFKAVLNDAWERSLAAGELYANIHTAKNADGEIRASFTVWDDPNEELAPDCTGLPSLPLVAGPAPATDAGTTPPTNTGGDTDPLPADDDDDDSSGDEETPAAKPAAEAGGCRSAGRGLFDVLPLGLAVGVAWAIRRRRRGDHPRPQR